jgi:hypothetical protein
MKRKEGKGERGGGKCMREKGSERGKTEAGRRKEGGERVSG